MGQELDYHYLYYSVGGDYNYKVTPYWLRASRYQGKVPLSVPENARTKDSTFLAVESMEAINAMLEAPEDYEWLGTYVFLDGREAGKWGLFHDLENYYDAELWDESREKYTLDNNVAYWKETILYQGGEHTVYFFNVYQPAEDHTVEVYKYCCVPKGFDGLVYVMYAEEYPFPGGIFPGGTHFYDYINEETIFLRLR